MAATVESTSNTAWSTGSSTLTLTKPSGAVDGDFLVAVVAGADNGGGTPTVSSVPSGWTLEDSIQNTSAADVTLYIYSKIADSEGSSWNWTIGTSADYRGGGVYRISGGDQITSTDKGTANNNPNPSYGTGITPVGQSLIIMAMAATDVVTNPTTVSNYAITTDNPSWTEAFDLYNTNSPDMSLASAYAHRTQTSATGAWSLSFSAGSVQDSCSIIMTIPDVTDVNTSIDTAGILTLSGNDITVKLDRNTSIDAAGILTLGGNDVTISTQERTAFTNQNKSSSPSWSNQSKS